jgi:formamidopyrimidine-DNA glycosylase
VPELPEVETVRRDLQAALAGRSISEVVVSGQRSIRRHRCPDELISRVQGRRLLEAGRHGKYLLLSLDSGDVLVAHLGMSGQFLTASAATLPQPHTHVVLRFCSGRAAIRRPAHLR